MVFVVVLVSVLWLSCAAVVFAACRVAGRADAGEPVYGALKRDARVPSSWQQAAGGRRETAGAPVPRLRSGYRGLQPRLRRGTYSHPSPKAKGNEHA
jgi:hypothetical protein